ncbi:Fe-S cluster biogenesis protein NfuA [Arcicella aurantiaca]|uniref:Fe-S cluster biogenesis protein NfuA n=2 Tax=Arcicella aurantiaca TaxID=591202 RepID=A0A316DJK7_9BACT|nr:Fe-S cluster biogenesis protein NfuA [Arcicella aurantiaca]
MKFVLNFELVPDGSSFDYATPADAIVEGKNSPLAVELFGFDFVQRVFISSNFITVTKNDETKWEDELFGMKQFLKQFFEDKKEVFAKATIAAYEAAGGEQDSETVIKIKAVLDQYVRPAVESDGGAINFHSFNEGTVKVLLQGSCSGCPSSTITLKQGIENLLTRMVPEVKEVVAEGV